MGKKNKIKGGRKLKKKSKTCVRCLKWGKGRTRTKKEKRKEIRYKLNGSRVTGGGINIWRGEK